ncbi:hypothetical protein G9C85_06125 [Halorubellus sp. JP-L1]|uniref:hypothetical protein n=1 Tax=Halorubellus sp. JP-L1 TaxID=2715753 RepID=UPI001407F250|nr:hypothetical protein [Halorubellus sp. JP-L1]NHN41214.1 hypothetical protein [Halorubellus sp. JP-L1]
MDDWESVAMALEGVCVALGAVAVLAAAVGVPGIVDPFVLGSGLFALGFALGAMAARSRGDRAGVALHAAAVAGWTGVLAGSALANALLGRVGVALLAVAGVGLCYRALRAWRTGDASASAG